MQGDHPPAGSGQSPAYPSPRRSAPKKHKHSEHRRCNAVRPLSTSFLWKCFVVQGGADSPPAISIVRAPEGYRLWRHLSGALRFFPVGRTKPSSVCLRQPPSPTAPSALGKAFGCVLNWGGGFLGELIWSLNSPLDCPEPNARPTGLRPSIHPHPPPLCFGTFPYRALGAGEGFWGWCLLEASAEIVSEALAQYFTQGLALLGGEQTRGEEIDILDAGVEHVQAADLKDAGELL